MRKEKINGKERDDKEVQDERGKRRRDVGYIEGTKVRKKDEYRGGN